MRPSNFASKHTYERTLDAFGAHTERKSERTLDASPFLGGSGGLSKQANKGGCGF